MISVADLSLVASNLERPEGICMAPDGGFFVSDRTALIRHVSQDGSQRLIGSGGVAPNGLALDHEGHVLVADYGDGAGLVRVDPSDGTRSLTVRRVEGRSVRRANHPAVDGEGRIWCTQSTDSDDDVAAVLEGRADGFLFVVNPDGSSHLARDGLCFPNGIAFALDGRSVFVAESGARRISRAEVLPGARLGKPEPYGPALAGVPDGIAVDAAGDVWVSLVFERHAVVTIAPSGAVDAVVEDHDATVLRNPTNIAFDDRGNLLITSADTGSVFRAQVRRRGAPLPLPGRS